MATVVISNSSALRAIRIVHTVVWAFFASCIVAIPVAVFMNRLHTAGLLVALVSVEVAVLALNGLRCPLTTVAARHTTERRDNFDIYLPLWLARYNKQIFGTLYIAGIVMLFARWRGWA